MCEKFHQLLAVGRWFPPGTPVSSTRKLISSSFHRLDMTLAVAEALNTNKPNQTFENVERLKKQYFQMLTEISLAEQSGYVSSADSHINVTHCIL